ncbi:MAG: Gfo/Idh/MocA family oxidoreductase [Bacteroidetes bacterium]|nr:Gfo/Idh/MocA family oxidoreductase [Bacteroidota bacterium]MCY4205487.1 Gfo/Idh/MocA family oxidoreductase [Bacteroidota bacterium]
MDRVRLAQIGVGHWGKNLLRNFNALPACRVVAACDSDSNARQFVENQYPATETTANVDDILERDDIDGVIIATETPSHFSLACATLKSGRHVFVEKPMTETVEEAETLISLSNEVGRHCMVGHLLLYHPAFNYVEDLIRDGTLGETYYMYSVRVNLGIVRQRENALQSLAPHDLSIALAFLQQKPVAVAVHAQAYLQPDICDVAFSTIFFESGALAHLHTSWLDPHKVRKVTLVGSKKMAVIDEMSSAEKVRIYDKGVNTPEYVGFAESMTMRVGDINIPNIRMSEPLRLECSHFIDCIRTGKTPRSDASNGLAVVRLLDAAQKSLLSGGAKIPVYTH